MTDAYENLRHRLAAIRNGYLRQLAEADPTLTRLKAALEDEQRWHAMTPAELLAEVTQLEATYTAQGEPPRGTA
jgi:hypothetical protein